MTKQAKWTIDPGHSVVQFKARHLAISNVTGTFKTFQGAIQCANEDFSDAEVQVTLDVDSIDTNNDNRDNHLRSAEFFDAQQYPHIQFNGSLKITGDNYSLPGQLTLRGITLPVTLEVEFTGAGKGRFGDNRAAFEVNGKINRKDFGLTWNMPTEAGGLILGEEIKLHFDIQLIEN
jgi:polyisoprenoid-binding protein YceI